MAGWRMSCPVCRGSLEDVRPVDLLARLDEEDPLLVRVAEDARRGEQIMERGLQRLERVGEPLIELMRILLLPRPPSPGDRPFRIEIPRLLDVVVPGFDLYLREHHPYFRRPATLLLTIGVRLPVLAGIGIVAARPGYWAERLLSGAGKANWKRLMTCFRSLIAASSTTSAPLLAAILR
jgi:hypothetical protein